jgi:hypothetical protein
MIVARYGPIVARLLGMAAVLVVLAAVGVALVHRHKLLPLPGWPSILAGVAFAAVVIGTVADVRMWRAMKVVFRAQQVDWASASNAGSVGLPAAFAAPVGRDILPQPGFVMGVLVGGVGLVTTAAAMGLLLVGLFLPSASARLLRFLRPLYGIGLVVVCVGFVVLVTPLYLPSRLAY